MEFYATTEFRLDINKKGNKEIMNQVQKRALKKKNMAKTSQLQSLQTQIKSKGIKCLKMDNELQWVAYKDIKKDTLKPIFKLSKMPADIEMIYAQ